jgi:hypothetical protein
VAMGLEGYICILMTLPIVLPLMFIGSIAAHFAKKYDQIKSTEKLPVLLLPLFIFLLGAPFEQSLVNNKNEIREVRSEIILPYSNMQVYDAIKTVDTLIAKKPFLMLIDLPVPQKCVLLKEEVGGIRICYFTGGRIIERITRLEKGKVLEMDVIKYELTGRKWLGFKKAIYRFNILGTDSCKMTRITTYTSELKPTLYWEPLEKLGIEQEHEYVFSNLVNDLDKKYGKLNGNKQIQD